MTTIKEKWTVKKLSITGGLTIHAGNDLVAGLVEETDAQLIVTAVNACIKLNPENPLAVAKAITILHQSLKGLMKVAETAMPDTYFASDTKVNLARKALTKVKEK